MTLQGSKPLGPTVAGLWYPAGAEALATEMDALLARATVDAPSPSAGRVTALIAPHAGYAYSGPTAARGFSHLRGARYRRVILIGPSHYAAFRGAALPRASAYRTPLGAVPLDLEAVCGLESDAVFQRTDEPFLREHSLEAEIPFLQRCLAADWLALPVLIGAGSSFQDAARVARGLRAWIDEDVLAVVSSDFTHYGPRFDYVPFHVDVAQRILQLDHAAIDFILRFDASGFEEFVTRSGATVCGRRAIDVLLQLPEVKSPGTLTGYDTSGRITGAWDHSVSYASLVFRRTSAETRCPS